MKLQSNQVYALKKAPVDEIYLEYVDLGRGRRIDEHINHSMKVGVPFKFIGKRSIPYPNSRFGNMAVAIIEWSGPAQVSYDALTAALEVSESEDSESPEGTELS